MVAAVGRGRILIWEGASLWLMEALPESGAAKATDLHSHHAVQVTLSLGGDFELRTHEGRIAQDAAVAPDVSHMLKAVGRIAILFIEPERNALFAENVLVALPAKLAAELIDRIGHAIADPRANDVSMIAAGRTLVALLAGEADAELPDIRVQKITAYLASRLDRPVSLAAAAKIAGLSAGRARHLFVEHTGLPFRTYLLWLRLMKAVGIFAGGGSLTEAAHEAGFSDSAHFSRTFRRMFGIPAAALRLSPFIQVPARASR